MYIAKKRLYLNANKTRIVDENSPEAAFLLAAIGQELPDDVALRYGLLEAETTTSASAPVEIESPQEQEPRRKRGRPPSDKRGARPQDK